MKGIRKNKKICEGGGRRDTISFSSCASIICVRRDESACEKKILNSTIARPLSPVLSPYFLFFFLSLSLPHTPPGHSLGANKPKLVQSRTWPRPNTDCISSMNKMQGAQLRTRVNSSLTACHNNPCFDKKLQIIFENHKS